MKRREFVKGSLATSAALYATSMFGLENIGGANDTVNIGIIGTGDRGGGLIPIINEIPNLRVVACCDIIPFRLEEGLAKVDM